MEWTDSTTRTRITEYIVYPRYAVFQVCTDLEI